ncbi:SLC13 family permease [Galbibacter pacificus]|uniref:SLC13 family permease n=1 Tax=Galbibacter pacificus TaxID=2996052 RepID=A0ABT6FQ98_9FLAO|nr:SLC13 family permease [Galbibacter pacificus]MDG3582085.1 SLC13 family permease [Galbibacter pacificus]MDG3585439.1 SLC13 family permease [Galbibacter pacificus]
MSVEIIYVFSVLFLVVLFFAFEVFPVDKIAFFIIVSLLLFGVVSPEEAVSGFSNSATITVLCLMIIAIALEQNGIINILANGLKKLKVLPILLLIPAFMVISGSISAFISTTAVVIVFIKILTELSAKYNIPRSKLLLPISFAGILGGSCTLMGTSTNLIVNSVATKFGAERFTFFEFSFYGLIFLGIGIVFITLTSFLLPWDTSKNLNSEYELDQYLTNVEIGDNSGLIDKKIVDTFLYNDLGITLLKLTRKGISNKSPGKYITLKKNDKLLLSCNMENLVKIKGTEGLVINEYDVSDVSVDDNIEIDPQQNTIVELLMLPGAPLLKYSIDELKGRTINGALPLAIKRRKNITNVKDKLLNISVDKIKLRVGDRLLVEIPEGKLSELSTTENMTVLQEHASYAQVSKTKKMLTFCIMLAVIGLAAFGVLSILASSLTGCFLLLFFNCIELSKVYQNINWEIIFLLAGMIPLGIAMNNSGADAWVSSHLLELISGKQPVIIIALLFLFTMLLSGIISNNATAIIMTPIAISLATASNLPLKPFILAVLFSANFSFFTPLGYQTNTLIYGLGLYKFKHFLIIGGILSIILWVTASLLLGKMIPG